MSRSGPRGLIPETPPPQRRLTMGTPADPGPSAGTARLVSAAIVRCPVLRPDLTLGPIPLSHFTGPPRAIPTAANDANIRANADCVALRSDRPKPRRASLRASVSSDRRAQASIPLPQSAHWGERVNGPSISGSVSCLEGVSSQETTLGDEPEFRCPRSATNDAWEGVAVEGCRSRRWTLRSPSPCR